MSLDPLHEQLAHLALSLPEAGQAALAGGGAMLAYDLVVRPTRDIDLFSTDLSDVRRLTDAFVVAVCEISASAEVVRQTPSFVRVVVTMPDGRALAVDIAHDARIREAVQLAFGPVLHRDEVAADKTLALFSRAAARDLVDVDALLKHYTPEQLFELASEKDPGFERGRFAEALAAAAADADAAFTELGFDVVATESLRSRADELRRQLLAGTTGTPKRGPAAAEPPAS